MKHQMGAATQAQQGMTFHITLIFLFLFLPWEPVQFSDWMPSDNLNGSHLNPVLTENWTENRRRFSAGEWEPPKTGENPTDQINSQLHKIVQVNSKIM
jgi:hypothetical protein